MHFTCHCKVVQVKKTEVEEAEGVEEKVNNNDRGEDAEVEMGEKNETGHQGGTKEQKKEKKAEKRVNALRAPRHPKTLQIKVTLLDNALYECELDVSPLLTLFVFTQNAMERVRVGG